MKPIYLLLLVLVTGCSISETVYNYVADNISDEPEIELVEDIDSELEDVEEIVEGVEKEIAIEDSELPIIITEDGIMIVLESVNKEFIGNNLHVLYKFNGKNLLEQGEDLRNWKFYIYLTKSQLVEMSYCTASQISSTEWTATYCMTKNDFENYGDDIKLVYTNRAFDDLRNKSYRKLDNLDKVFVFDPIKV